MDESKSAYPELVAEIDILCQGKPWCITGASALVFDDNALYFEITKPKHWRISPDGSPVAGLGCIGGSIEASESILDCLHREAREELGTDIRVHTAAATQLVYEQRVVRTCEAPIGGVPHPCLSTISANLYRQDALPTYDILAIMTLAAELMGTPTVGDLGALVRVPFGIMPNILCNQRVTLRHLRALSGVAVCSNLALPSNLAIMPVWTTRSLQLAWQAERSPIEALMANRSPRSQ